VAVLSARGTGHNYFHFMFDAVPRIGMLRAALPAVEPDLWVVDLHARFQKELLDLVGLGSVKAVAPHRRMALQARRLLVPSLPNVGSVISPETTSWLARALPPSNAQDLPDKIYVTRGSAPRTRSMVHEDEVRGMLEGRGFACIDPGRMSVQEQIDAFAAARVIVAPHGAALTNVTFCRPGVRVLELFAPTYLNASYWAATSNVEDSHYRYLVAAGEGPPPGSRFTILMDDIDLRAAQVEEALDALLAD
jgi:capsular polysaccharide biosynthesis protein